MLSGLRSAPLLHAAAMTVFAIAALLVSPVCADDQIGDHWVAIWGASPSIESRPITFDNQSVRQITLVTIGGRGQRLRVRLSNELGAEDLIVGAAHIGLATSGGSILPNSDRTLTFSGETSVAIPAGAPVVSDPVDFDLGAPLPNLSHLAVSLYFPNNTVVEALHPYGEQTAYITDGNTTGATNLGNVRSISQSRFFVSRIDVLAAPEAIVALGDSITDGYCSTPRWRRALARLSGSAPGQPYLFRVSASNVCSQCGNQRQPAIALWDRPQCIGAV
jgi:hypothetical protein